MSHQNPSQMLQALAPLIRRNLEAVKDRKGLRAATAPLCVTGWFNSLPAEERVKICQLVDRIEKQVGTVSPSLRFASGSLDQVMENGLARYGLSQFCRENLKNSRYLNRQEARGLAEITGSVAGHTKKVDEREQLVKDMQARLSREAASYGLENYRLTWAEKSERKELHQKYDTNRDGHLQPHEITQMRRREQSQTPPVGVDR